MTALALALLGAPGLANAGLCEQGKRQSPIDIVAPTRKALPALQFNYRAAPLRVVNDGHTVRVRFANGSQVTVGRERYALQQFHIHVPGGDRHRWRRLRDGHALHAHEHLGPVDGAGAAVPRGN